MGGTYSVDHASASTAAATTSTEVDALEDVSTAITEAITAAEGALPPEFQIATQRLKNLRVWHVQDVGTVKTFAAGAVSALEECLKSYETATADMVAESYAMQQRVSFDHSTALGITERQLNEGLDDSLKSTNESLPKNEEGRSGSWNHTSTTSHDGSAESRSTTTTSTRGGASTSSSSAYSYGYDNGVTTSSTTRTATHTSKGVTDTTTYYNGTSFRGNDEVHASGQSYSVSRGTNEVHSTVNGSMQVRYPR